MTYEATRVFPCRKQPHNLSRLQLIIGINPVSEVFFLVILTPIQSSLAFSGEYKIIIRNQFVSNYSVVANRKCTKCAYCAYYAYYELIESSR